ncbi:hypothetical protein EUX98_g4121 [Antrodiella citrinella]|uniref:Uncharacterized protein n=1 Tax=Antrodiella citrinella TaxID=2447956 RepID=A0A4V3XIQ0_9APHY|nr:hypothetical protein EUX98_g4121 [Antrodiella citrinella]
MTALEAKYYHALEVNVDVSTRFSTRQRLGTASTETQVVYTNATNQIVESARSLNASSPLLQLPTELLLQIVHSYIALGRNRTQKQLSARYYSWLGITHVCHRLRVVALADPTLWTRISVIHPEFLREVLARSQGMPLTYELGHMSQGESTLSAVNMMLGSLDRVESLKYLYSSNHYGKFPEFTSHAPKLRSLEVRNAEQVHPRTATVKAPLFFKDCELPILEKLDVALLPFASVQAMFRPSLKFLSISTSTVPGISSILINALKDMPLLETLDLHQVLPESNFVTTPEVSSQLPMVSLPRLRSLRITRCGAVECAEFLSHLSFPPTTTLNLELRPCGRRPWVNSVIPNLAAKFKERQPIETVCIHSPWNTDVQVTAWSRTMSMDEIESREAPTPDLLIKMYGHNNGTVDCDETLVSLTCDLPLASVKTLVVGELRDYLKRNSSWIAVFTPMVQIETMGLVASTGEFVASVFHPPRDQKPSFVGSGEVMPKLKTLSLRKVAFKVDYEEDVIYPYDYIHALRSCLTSRSEKCVKLETLRIREAINLGEDDVEVFKNVATNVDWDHIMKTESVRRKLTDEKL